MRQTNRRTISYLLKELKFEEVWLKAHTKFHDTVYTSHEKYKALDLFNLWDGIGLRQDNIYFLQLKTNAWPKEQPMIDWCTKYNAKAMAINVKVKSDDPPKYDVLIREY